VNFVNFSFGELIFGEFDLLVIGNVNFIEFLNIHAVDVLLVLHKENAIITISNVIPK